MRITVNGVRLFFDIEGSSTRAVSGRLKTVPPLVLLHGGPAMDHMLYRPYFSTLASQFQVIYLDMRGHGRSEDGPVDSWTLDQWADDVATFCHALDLENPIIYGQSFGALVGLNYAIRHPHQPGKLIFSGAAARFHLERKLRKFEAAGGAEARTAAEIFWTAPSEDALGAYSQICMPLYNPTDCIDHGPFQPKLRMAPFMHFCGEGREMMHFDLRPQLAEIRTPTLLLSGGHDPITTVEDGQEVFDHMAPDICRLEIFEDAGHVPERSAPDKVFALVRAFAAD